MLDFSAHFDYVAEDVFLQVPEQVPSTDKRVVDEVYQDGRVAGV